MKSNYDILGNHIRLIDTRNTDSVTDRVALHILAVVLLQLVAWVWQEELLLLSVVVLFLVLA